MYNTIRNKLERDEQAVVAGLTLQNIDRFRAIMREIERRTQVSYAQFYYGDKCFVERVHGF